MLTCSLGSLDVFLILFFACSKASWVAPNAAVIGKVRLDEGSSVWFGATLRGDNVRVRACVRHVPVFACKTCFGCRFRMNMELILLHKLQELIHIGKNSNIQDGCVLHTDMGFPLTIGSDVTVGHMVVAFTVAIPLADV